MVETIAEQFGKWALPNIADWLIPAVIGSQTINNSYGRPQSTVIDDIINRVP